MVAHFGAITASEFTTKAMCISAQIEINKSEWNYSKLKSISADQRQTHKVQVHASNFGARQPCY